MTTAILDTNILLSVFELNHDFIEEVKKQCPNIATLSVVVEELKLRTDKNGKMALQLVQKANISVIDVKLQESVDSTLLAYCEAHNCILVTQDKELRERAKQKALKTLGIRQRRYIK